MGLIRRATRYGLTGVLVTLLHIMAAIFMIKFLSFNQPLANALASFLAMMTSYILNSVWSFERALARRTLLRYLAVSVAGMVATVLIASLNAKYGYHYLIGILAIVMLVTPITFILHNNWTYKSQKPT